MDMNKFVLCVIVCLSFCFALQKPEASIETPAAERESIKDLQIQVYQSGLELKRSEVGKWEALVSLEAYPKLPPSVRVIVENLRRELLNEVINRNAIEEGNNRINKLVQEIRTKYKVPDGWEMNAKFEFHPRPIPTSEIQGEASR